MNFLAKVRNNEQNHEKSFARKKKLSIYDKNMGDPNASVFVLSSFPLVIELISQPKMVNIQSIPNDS